MDKIKKTEENLDYNYIRSLKEKLMICSRFFHR